MNTSLRNSWTLSNCSIELSSWFHKKSRWVTSHHQTASQLVPGLSCQRCWNASPFSKHKEGNVTFGKIDSLHTVAALSSKPIRWRPTRQNSPPCFDVINDRKTYHSSTICYETISDEQCSEAFIVQNSRKPCEHRCILVIAWALFDKMDDCILVFDKADLLETANDDAKFRYISCKYSRINFSLFWYFRTKTSVTTFELDLLNKLLQMSNVLGHQLFPAIRNLVKIDLIAPCLWDR